MERAKKPDVQVPGPEPERLKLPGDWETAIGEALKKERPPEGWPERPKKKEGRRGK